MRTKVQHHFLAYTIEHILGSFFVISIAMFVGYAAYASDATVSNTDATSTIPAYTLTPPILGIPDVTTGKVALSWAGVNTAGSVLHGFAVYRNEVVIANVTVSSYVDSSGLTPGMSYVYFIKTIDTTGNASLASNEVTVTMPLATNITTSPATTTPTSSPTPTPITPSTPELLPVSFAVAVAPIVDCTNGKAMNEVFFSTSDASGGSFKLSSDNGINNAPLEWGRYPLPNGKYSWTAVVRSGYAPSGDVSGYLSLSGVCAAVPIATATSTPTTSSAGSQNTVDTFPLKYPENANVIPAVTIDSVRVTSGDTVSGVVAFNVVARGSTRTVFVLESALGTKQYVDKQLGVVHKDGTDEWSTLWSTTNMDNGEYTLAALMDTSAGTMISKKFTFTVKNGTTPAAASVLALKKPTLKIFLNNIVVSSGAVLTIGDTAEFRVGALDAKKVSFYAMPPSGTTPIELGSGVVDDLLSGKTQDIWTATFETNKVKIGSYKLFARVLYLDGTVSESQPFSLSVGQLTGGNVATSVVVASDTKSTDINLLASKEEILSRVTEPALCTTPEECKVFCTSNAALNTCAAFARMSVGAVDLTTSLVEGISEEHITRVLLDPRRRSDIPTSVESANDLMQYCAEPSHVDICAKMLTKNDLASEVTIDEKKKALTEAKDKEAKLLSERVGARVFIDSDKDTLSDYDEVNIYHTDPTATDTDHDGVPDNVEIEEHTNPHGGKATQGEGTTSKITIEEGVRFEDPLITGVEKKDLLSVSNVQVAEVGTDANGTSTAKKLFLAGRALPNSYVTLYIFSSPIIVTVRADASGAWTYTLDKELPDGSHQAISAVTDEGGHILAKSEPLPFVKVAAAVSVGSNALIPSNETPGFFTGASLYAFIAILIGLIGVAFSIIGFMVKGRTEKDAPLFPPIGK